jgi:hypothetical protein
MPRNYHVTPNSDGAWDAKARAHTTQAEAEAAAKRYSSNQGGSEVRIHRTDGTIGDSDTVPPAPDPNPARDTKH